MDNLGVSTVTIVVRLFRINYPINNRGVKINDVIINIYINTFGVALIENFNLISVVITTNIMKEIIVYMGIIIPK